MKITPSQVAALECRRSSSSYGKQGDVSGATDSTSNNTPASLPHRRRHGGTATTPPIKIKTNKKVDDPTDDTTIAMTPSPYRPTRIVQRGTNSTSSDEDDQKGGSGVVDILPHDQDFDHHHHHHLHHYLQRQMSIDEVASSPSWSSSSVSTSSSFSSVATPSPPPTAYHNRSSMNRGSRSGSRSRDNKTKTAAESAVEESLLLSVDHDGPIPYMARHAVGLDCEMVGVGPGGKISVLARVSLVDYYGRCIYDSFVKVEERVTDYRTYVSGVTPQDIQNGVEFGQVRKAVRQILRGKIVVGHGLENDLRALKIEQEHPWYTLRDSATQYQPFMRVDQYGRLRPKRLRDLVWYSLGVIIQQDSKPHCSLEDARAAMALYRYAQENWEYEMECLRQTFVQSSPSYHQRHHHHAQKHHHGRHRHHHQHRGHRNHSHSTPFRNRRGGHSSGPHHGPNSPMSPLTPTESTSMSPPSLMDSYHSW